MIHFFRKIRQNLLSENRISKYLVYAIGEIILVMIGILLALQFNNWNTQSENNKKERWYLINIVEDLEYQRVILKDMRDLNIESINIGKYLLKNYMETKSFLEIDSFNEKLNILMTSYRYPNTNNTYSELISSGQFGLITDKTLSIDIVNYYTSSDGNYNDINNDIENVFYPEIYPIYNKLSQTELYKEDINKGEEYLLEIDDSFTNYINTQLEKTEVKLALINAIKTQIFILKEHDFMIQESIELNIELIKSIDNYLGLTPDMVNKTE